MSLALLKAAGQSLQQECSEVGAIGVGEVAVTGGGNLKCRHVFHIVLPSYKRKNEAEKVMRL